MNCRGCNASYLKGLIGSSEYLVVQNSRQSHLPPSRTASCAYEHCPLLVQHDDKHCLFYFTVFPAGFIPGIAHVETKLHRRFATEVLLKPVNPSRTYQLGKVYFWKKKCPKKHKWLCSQIKTITQSSIFFFSYLGRGFWQWTVPGMAFLLPWARSSFLLLAVRACVYTVAPTPKTTAVKKLRNVSSVAPHSCQCWLLKGREDSTCTPSPPGLRELCEEGRKTVRARRSETWKAFFQATRT